MSRYSHSTSLLFGMLVCLIVAGCAGPRTVGQSVGHVVDEEPEASEPPAVVPPAAVAPEPRPEPPVETYSVVVKDVPVIDILFSLARDVGLELDMQADGEHTVTINAVEQPLRNILNRITEQARLRFELRGRNLIIRKDQPYWHNYRVDYVNITRTSEGEVGVATQIATSGGTVGEQTGQQADQQGNLSKTTVKSSSDNNFWSMLEDGLMSIVASERERLDSPAENDPIIVNSIAGVITVLATQRQHQRVQTYLDTIMSNSQRQVLIEMTIVEVELNDNYQAGVDWHRLSDNEGAGSNGISVQTSLLGPDLTVPPFVALGWNREDADGSSISATVRLLQQFGDTKVLSSPKIMALNNQTALLKVVNETVFFTIELDIRDATINIPERRTFTSEVHTVPIGLVLSVTPQISDNGYVSLNIRPTISRITGFAVDPAPRLAGAEFDNLIPEIQVREIESLLKVLDGRTIVLGGLMQNEQVSEKDGIPGLSRIPTIGKLFSYTRDKLVKTELVIFLRPTIIDNGASPEGSPTIRDYLGEMDSPALSKVEYR